MSFYLIDDLEQGSSEWHAWRKGVIGASDAPKIMGENPWGSRSSLLDEKLGLAREFQGNAKTREGNSLEGDARSSLAKKFKMKLHPTIVQDSKEPFLAASLDAMCSDYENLFEIKAGVKAYEYTQLNKTVPDYYVGQLQHMLMVTELESLTYAVYRPSRPLLTLEIYRDDRYIKRLRKKEKEFIEELEDQGHEFQYQFVGRLVNK
jgi:putative phage-type endonuclease